MLDKCKVSCPYASGVLVEEMEEQLKTDISKEEGIGKKPKQQKTPNSKQELNRHKTRCRPGLYALGESFHLPEPHV